MRSRRFTALTRSRSFSSDASVRAVFLDVGGTLLHLDRGFILGCLAERGIVRDAAAFQAADRAARAHVGALLNSGQPGTDVSRWRAYSRTMLAALGCSDVDEAAVRVRLHEHNAAGRLWSHAEPGTRDILEDLRRRGFMLVVVSNSDGRVHQFLDDAGLLPMIDHVIDSGSVGVEKPDPRIFQIACERAGVAPAEAVHVGDIYEIDVVGARAAGVAPILLDPADLHAHIETPRIRDLGELVPLLTGSAAA